jgi:hypothetical protein
LTGAMTGFHRSLVRADAQHRIVDHQLRLGLGRVRQVELNARSPAPVTITQATSSLKPVLPDVPIS